MEHDLIERLACAKGPDRRLDREIEVLAFPMQSLPTPHYTKLVDDALQLVPEGLHGSVDFGKNVDGMGRQLAHVFHQEVGTAASYGKGANSALALCVAALKARAVTS